MAGKKPNMTGKIQTEDQEDSGKISLWENESPFSLKSPKLTGYVEIYIPEISANRKFKVSIWEQN